MAKTKFTVELFDKICSDIAESKDGLHKICKKHKVSARRFYEWINEDDAKEEDEQLKLSHKYAHARELQAEYLADLIHEVAFDDKDDEKAFVGANHIQRDRLKIDALKWTASKLLPKKYGDKVDITSKGEELKAPIITGMIIKNEDDEQ